MFRYRSGVLDLKTRSPITVILERGEGFFAGCKLSCSHTWEKSRSNEERPAQAIFRQTHTEASRRRRTGRQSVLSTSTLERKGRCDERFFQGGLHDRHDWIKFNSAIFACATELSTI